MSSRALLFVGILLLCMNLYLSKLLAEAVKKRTSESYLLLNKLIFTPVPRDLHYGLSDTNFANTVSYIGYVLEKHKGKILKEEGNLIYTSLDAVTFYNPRYFDPYYVANAFLTWELGMYEETLQLLKRGMKFIQDWRLPFYIGFIYFYFLNDKANGAEYLSLSAKYKRDGKSNLAALLASRLYYEEGKLGLAIVLLKEQIKVIKDESSKKALKERLKTLETAYRIYIAINKFQQTYGRKPKNIEELVKAKLIPSNLRDHLGGRFYITPDGKVRSEKVLFPMRKRTSGG